MLILNRQSENVHQLMQTLEERKKRRMRQNRISALKCRQKKKEHFSKLEGEHMKLQHEHSQLELKSRELENKLQQMAMHNQQLERKIEQLEGSRGQMGEAGVDLSILRWAGIVPCNVTEPMGIYLNPL